MRLKKLLALGLGLTLGMGVFALSACDLNTDDSGNDDPDISGENPGGENPGGEAVGTRWLAVEGSVVAGSSDDLVSVSGVELDIDVSGLLDTESGDFDVQVGVASPAEGSGYIFGREGIPFLTIETYTGEITDYSTVKLEAADELVSFMPYLLYIPEALNAQTLDPLNTFAEAYGGVTKSGSSVTLNLIAMAENMMDEVYEILDGLTAEMTISQVYEADIFKNILTAVNGYIPTETLVEYAEDAILAAMGAQLPEGQTLLPAPTANQTLYDYIGALLDDELFAAKFGMDKALGELTAAEIIAMIAASSGADASEIDFDEFKATLKPMLESVISFDNGELRVGNESGGMIISKAAITYSTGANDAVTQIGIDLEMAVVELGTEYSYDIQLGAKYLSEGELADIGGATVVLGSEEYTVDEFLAQYSAEDFPLGPSEGGDTIDPPVENPDDSVGVLPDVA